MGRNGNRIELAGKTFGLLTVLGRQGAVRQSGAALWKCRCTCGVEVIVASDKLRYGKRKACARNGHHYRSTLPRALSVQFPSEHASWESMWERCTSSKHRNWHNYGGRGIVICKPWEKFEQFLADMGPKPSRYHTIDRCPDPNGNYEPTNCRWATHEEQTRGRRNLVKVIYEGAEMLLIDVVKKVGAKRGIVYGRLKMGWSLEDALWVPLFSRKRTGPRGPYKKKRR